MVPIGIDVHKRRCKVLEFNYKDGEVKVRRPIENRREDWLGMLPELPPDAEIALEVSTAGLLLDWLFRAERLLSHSDATLPSGRPG